VELNEPLLLMSGLIRKLEGGKKTIGGFKTKQEVEDAATALMYELKHGTYVEEKDTLFKDFVVE
jgi:hypothetical protein